MGLVNHPHVSRFIDFIESVGTISAPEVGVGGGWALGNRQTSQTYNLKKKRWEISLWEIKIVIQNVR